MTIWHKIREEVTTRLIVGAITGLFLMMGGVFIGGFSIEKIYHISELTDQVEELKKQVESLREGVPRVSEDIQTININKSNSNSNIGDISNNSNISAILLMPESDLDSIMEHLRGVKK